MSPTVFRYKGYRFFFFSREERRIHIHVSSADGEAKFWIDPEISLERNHGLSDQAIVEILAIVEERRDEIIAYWNKHFKG